MRYPHTLEFSIPPPRKAMAPPKKTASPEVALYDRLIATIPSIERKGAANPYTSLNGNMFTLLHQSRLAIRLPEDRREEFLKKYKTKLFEAYGTVMEEYVAVPATLLRNERELKKYLELSYEYAKTLKTKPSRKKSSV
jgi:TfoX/Sxy family transcriptional regulator of competence genes